MTQALYAHMNNKRKKKETLLKGGAVYWEWLRFPGGAADL
jgi:hypothetical protein